MPAPDDRLVDLRTEAPHTVPERRRNAEDLIRSYQDDTKGLYDFYAGDDDLNAKLAVAVSRGDAEHAARFIAQGADVNLVEAGRLPLIHEAVGLGHRAIVDAMLASGRCDLTIRDQLGRLPSQVADLVLRDDQLAERLAHEQARQFREKNIDPRRPDNPDYGNWRWGD